MSYSGARGEVTSNNRLQRTAPQANRSVRRRWCATPPRHFNAGHMNKIVAVALVLFASGTLHASEAERFVAKIKLPSGQTAVIAEGDLEARSIGSFSVRLYDAATPEDETTFYRTGQVRARDGTIEKVVVVDIAGDRRPEIVVIVRSAGTGGYLAAHAFTVDNQRLIFHSVVEGLPPDADPIAALRKLNRMRK
jgi:hypothetical protein